MCMQAVEVSLCFKFVLISLLFCLFTHGAMETMRGAEHCVSQQPLRNTLLLLGDRKTVLQNRCVSSKANRLCVLLWVINNISSFKTIYPIGLIVAIRLELT